MQTRRYSKEEKKLESPENINAESGAFKNFPDIHPKSAETLAKRGINFLFPVQYMSFNHVYQRKDLIVRDLTGSGKTLAFSLPMVEYLRKHKLLGVK